MEVFCPHCKKQFIVPNDYVGKKVLCENCKNSFILSVPNEVCENCDQSIGKLEKIGVFEGRIVCSVCDAKLRPPQTISETQAVVPANGNIPGNSTGEMKKAKITSGTVSGLILGILCILLGLWVTVSMCGGIVFGVPLIILGLFCGGRSKRVLKCERCAAAVERA